MKKIRSIAAILLTLALTLSLVGCGEIQKAEAAVNGTFAAFKEMDLEAAQKYVDINNITNPDGDTSETATIIMGAVFDKLSYEIISSEKIDSETVIVKTKITAIDMKPVMADYIAKAFEYAMGNIFADPQPTEEEMNQKYEEILAECATKPDLATVTNEVDITVVKTDSEGWKLDADEEFVDALLGGLVNALEEASDSFNGIE